MAIAALGHRRIRDRTLVDRRVDGKVVGLAGDDIAGRVGGGGDRIYGLAIRQPGQRVGPDAVGADSRYTTRAVGADVHRSAEIDGPGQRSRAVVEVGGVEVEFAVAAGRHRSVGNRALVNCRVDGEGVPYRQKPIIAGRVVGRGEGHHPLAVGQAAQRVRPGAVSGDRRVVDQGVNDDLDGIAGLNRPGQRGHAIVEMGGVEVELAVASLSDCRVGDRTHVVGRVDGKVVGWALGDVADTVGGCGDRGNAIAIGEPGQRVRPTAVGSDARLSVNPIDVDGDSVAGFGGPAQSGRPAVEVEYIDVELAVGAQDHVGIGNGALGGRCIDGEVVSRALRSVADCVGSCGDRGKALAVGQSG